MATLRHVAGLASLALITACYRQEPDLYSTFPEPTEVDGPPSGEIDREWQEGYVDDNAATTATAYVDASVGPPASGELVGSCTDGEISATLDPYGEWVWIEGYGYVWRPYPTAVGVDFTPYETCGTWVWTEWGWTFACEWDWGWLPFHYGRWGWFDDYWAWVPGYEWSPAWVEWRSGGDYVGWRPLAPTVRDHRTGHAGPIVRDHRSHDHGKRGGRGGAIVRDHRSYDPSKHGGVIVRDHRKSRRVASAKDWQWRFTQADDLGKPRIRSHLFKGLAEGLRVTSIATRPPARASVQQVKVASIMQPRLSFANHTVRTHQVAPVRAHGRLQPGPVRAGVGSRVPERARTQRPAFDRSSASSSVYQPTWQRPRPPRGSFGASQPSAVAPDHGATPTPTISTPPPPTRAPVTPHVPDHQRPTTIAPPAQTTPPQLPDRFQPPPVIRPPSRAPDGYRPAQPPIAQPPIAHPPPRYTPPPSYSPPARSEPTYSPPARSAPTYSPPARSTPTYSPPARSTPTYSPPARSYSPPARSYSPPAGASSARSHRR